MSEPRARSASTTRGSRSSWKATRPPSSDSPTMASRVTAIPSWGGWGGRYLFRQPYGESARHLDAGWRRLRARHLAGRACSARDGKLYLSDQATIWRWRTAFQHDFAARMDWTVTRIHGGESRPDRGGEWHRRHRAAARRCTGRPAPGVRRVRQQRPGWPRPALNYRWFHYAEAGFVPGEALAKVTLTASNAPRTTVTVTEACRPAWIPVEATLPAQHRAPHPGGDRLRVAGAHVLSSRDSRRSIRRRRAE